MAVRIICYTLFLLVAIFFSDQAKSDESSTSLTDLLIIEGILAGTFLITSNDPESWGKFFIITSPIVLGDIESKEEYWLAVAASAAYGIWLVDQEDEEESDLFKKQFLGFNALIMPFLIYKKVFDKEKDAEQSQRLLQTDPVNYGMRLNYTFRF